MKELNRRVLLAVWVMLFSNSALAENLDAIVKSVKEVCMLPSQQGKYWDVKVEGNAKADVTVKLVNAGIDGKATFNKTEWEGVKDILANNKDYRNCAVQLTQIFLEKFKPKTATKSANSNKTKSTKAKSSSAKSISAKSSEIHQESSGDISPNIVSDGDVTINVNQK